MATQQTTHRDRLVAALLAVDPAQAVLQWDEGVAVLTATETIRRIVVMLVPDGTPKDRVRTAVESLVKTVLPGGPTTYVVAVGGGAEIAEALNLAMPVSQSLPLGFYHLDDAGELARVAGQRSTLIEQAYRERAASPPDADAIASAVARGRAFIEKTRVVAARLRGRPRVTIALVAVCVALSALSYVWGPNAHDEVLWRMGANSGVAVRHGQVYRLFASAFLHANALHLIVNMIALWSFGAQLEMIFGPRRYVLLYGAAALTGAVASAFFGGDAQWSVGASGAVWGLMAAGIGLAVRPRGVLPPYLADRMKRSLWMPLAINVFYSFQPGIDMHAHFGGGAAGFALAATVLTVGLTPLDERTTLDDAERKPSPALGIAAIATGAAMAASIAAALLRGQPWVL